MHTYKHMHTCMHTYTRLNKQLLMSHLMLQDANAVFRQGKLLTMLGMYHEALQALTAAARASLWLPGLLSYVAFLQV